MKNHQNNQKYLIAPPPYLRFPFKNQVFSYTLSGCVLMKTIKNIFYGQEGFLKRSKKFHIISGFFALGCFKYGDPFSKLFKSTKKPYGDKLLMKEF